jgi:CheY-like chemotaxis protein
MNISDKLVHIFLVEDDEVDILYIKYTFREYNIFNTLDISRDGEEALEKILNFPADKLPKIILLDINMPKMNGFEFLEKIREYPTLASIPVIIISTSINNSDRKRASKLQVAEYFSKPLDVEKFFTFYRNL